MNLPCQIYVVKEDKGTTSHLLPLISLDQSEAVLKMCPALIMSASMPILRPVFYFHNPYLRSAEEDRLAGGLI